MARVDPARRLLRRLQREGWSWLFRATWDRIAPERPSFAHDVRRELEAGKGLEIGGPSAAFARRGVLPLYPHVASLDNVNFARDTAWENVVDGAPFSFCAGKSPGIQRIREAIDLHGIAAASYEFVLSSHCLEHVANPLRALEEWRRVTRAGGYLVLILPDPERSFDHRRPITTLAHLQADRANATPEHDATHFDEVLACHDLARDPGVGSEEEFHARTLRNAENRCVHHHVFDLDLMRAALAETGWRVVAAERVRPVHLIAFARKDTP